MGSIVLYILEWAFALIVLLIIYKAAFSGTTFYRFNRFYLLGATLLSALLPLVHVTIPDSNPLVNNLTIEDTVFAQELSGTLTMSEPGPELFTTDELVLPQKKNSLWAVLLIVTYTVYVAVLFIGWTRGILSARRFLRGKNRRRVSRTVWLVTHDEDFGPFSWMNYIVISDTESGFSRRASLRHEYSHVRLMHSIDLIILLACTIVNPVCWLVLQEIKIVHEFEADDEVINRYGIRNSDYQKLLIMRTVGAEAYALASSFNLNIKKRIIMMNKKKTLKRRLIWLLLLIPLLGMTSVLFAHTEKNIAPDDVLNLPLSDPSADLPETGNPSTQDDEYVIINDMRFKIRNYMSIMVNKNNDIYVQNGVTKRVIELSELKDIAKEFIGNPQNDSRLPVFEDYYIPGYKTVSTTTKHVISLQYDRSSSAGLLNDIRTKIGEAYNELRNEWCRKEFGKNYDQCSEEQQRYSRNTYPTKILEAEPKEYYLDGDQLKPVDNIDLKKGDIIKGLVIDQENATPIFMANVTEVDALGHIYSHSITDNEGYFSFRLVDPSNRLLVSYDGYLTAEQPIGPDQVVILGKESAPYYELLLEVTTDGMNACVTSNRRYDNGGKETISTHPVKLEELAKLGEYIDKAETEGKHITSVALNIHTDVHSGLVTDIKTLLRRKRILSIRYVGIKLD